MKPFLTFLWGAFSLVVGFVSAGWLVWRSLKKSDDPGRLITRWVVSVVICLIGVWICKGVARMGELGAFLLAGTAAGCGVALGIVWAPSLGTLLAKPLTGAIDGGDDEFEPQPLYSMAEARRKQGKYHEALAEIRKQLERFPEDFAGWMLLAEVQAENLHDVSSALESIDEVVSQVGHAPKNIAYALNRAADWHLKFAEDREAARADLERVIAMLPETEEAQMAAQRIAHLASSEMLAEKRERPTIALPHYDANAGLRSEFKGLELPKEDPAALAASYVKHLQEFPADNEIREKLALLYADAYGRLDLASAELEQLISAPQQLPKHVVHWLNVLADVQIRLTGDVILARETLGRIVKMFPKSAAAENAVQRMAYLKLELNRMHQTETVKMGTYEQNLGLKSLGLKSRPPT